MSITIKKISKKISSALGRTKASDSSGAATTVASGDSSQTPANVPLNSGSNSEEHKIGEEEKRDGDDGDNGDDDDASGVDNGHGANPPFTAVNISIGNKLKSLQGMTNADFQSMFENVRAVEIANNISVTIDQRNGMIPIHLKAEMDLLFNVNASLHFHRHALYRRVGLLGTIDWKLLPNDDFFDFVKLITLDKKSRTSDKTAALILQLEKVKFVFTDSDEDFKKIQTQVLKMASRIIKLILC